MTDMPHVMDADVQGKRVFLRCDYNVPLDDEGKIADESRILASLRTVHNLLDRGARVFVTSHLGRPKGVPDPALSLKPVATRLADLVGGEAVGLQERGLRQVQRHQPVQRPDHVLGRQAREPVVGQPVVQDPGFRRLEDGQVVAADLGFTQHSKTRVSVVPGSARACKAGKEHGSEQNCDRDEHQPTDP